MGLVRCGGNIDLMVLSSILQRGLVRTHRLVRIGVELRDVPGALGDLAARIGGMNCNIIEVTQQRRFRTSSARAVRVGLVLQMRGGEQAEAVLAALAEAGFDARRE